MSIDHDGSQMAQYLGNAVYGALDGTVTTFAIIAGAIGAQLPIEIIIILGLANLFADGFSMATGSYLSEKSKLDYLDKLVGEKETLITKETDTAQEEVEEIYKEKGFKGKDLSRAVHIVTARRSTYLSEILSAEGINTATIKPFTISSITFLAFVTVGATPILLLFIKPDITFAQLLITIGTVLFIVGSLRSRISALSWWRGGLEIMIAGISASLIAYIIGDTLTRVVAGTNEI